MLYRNGEQVTNVLDKKCFIDWVCEFVGFRGIHWKNKIEKEIKFENIF